MGKDMGVSQGMLMLRSLPWIILSSAVTIFILHMFEIDISQILDFGKLVLTDPEHQTMTNQDKQKSVKAFLSFMVLMPILSIVLSWSYYIIFELRKENDV